MGPGYQCRQSTEDPLPLQVGQKIDEQGGGQSGLTQDRGSPDRHGYCDNRVAIELAEDDDGGLLGRET
jgi:hypothetical protein